MPTNELLEAKYRAQRALSEQGGDDLHAYARNLRRIVQGVEQRYGLRFRYRGPGGETTPSDRVPVEHADENSGETPA